MATLASKITVPADVLFRDLQGESVILDLQSGKYYGLDEVGTRLWHLLARYGQLGPVYQSLLEEYDVAADQLQADILQLVDTLAGYELLQVNDE